MEGISIQQKIPLYDAVLAHAHKNSVRLHVPGHKGGHVFLEKASEEFQSTLALDLTELTGLDDLHDPTEAIQEAQQLAATCFFAEETYFLVGGSTVGNLAVIMGTLERNDLVLVQRNCHKSIYHGLALKETQVVTVEPELDPVFRVPVGPSKKSVQAALQRYPQAKALILTYPNYYGMAYPLAELIGLAQHYQMLVLVDEAHGAHFGQSSELPFSAMQLGADISVQSTHKMLSSLTMTSMLHLQGEQVARADIRFYLQALQSSSPSYPLLASLDLARAELAGKKEADWQQAVCWAREVAQEIGASGAYQVSGVATDGQRELAVQQDPFKLIIQPKFALSGFALQEQLKQENIYIELADAYNVLCTLPLIPHPAWAARLLQALEKIASQGSRHLLRRQNFFPVSATVSSDVPLAMRVIRSQEKEAISLHQAVGKRVAELIIPYPPGIPLLLPGEEIKKEQIEQINFLKEQGAIFQGKGQGIFDTIEVIKS